VAASGAAGKQCTVALTQSFRGVTPALFTSCTKSIAVRARRTRGKPPSFAPRGPSRRGRAKRAGVVGGGEAERSEGVAGWEAGADGPRFGNPPRVSITQTRAEPGGLAASAASRRGRAKRAGWWVAGRGRGLETLPGFPSQQTRAEPGGFAASAASREGLETLPGFPSQSTSPPLFRGPQSVGLDIPVGGPMVVNHAGYGARVG
jgi:hypothetical protein